MIQNAKTLAILMGVDLHNIRNVWYLFQLKKDDPNNKDIVCKALGNLSDKEKEFLMFLGLDRISTEMEKGG